MPLKHTPQFSNSSTIAFVFLIMLSCNLHDNKIAKNCQADVSSEIEWKVLDTISHLPEVIARAKYIDSITSPGRSPLNIQPCFG
ncbi:MAG: hypothetical protein JWQ27_389 [Ferruginibacter sp.]|nr:hypothetical protein [Ferruginibacter sp.]